MNRIYSFVVWSAVSLGGLSACGSAGLDPNETSSGDPAGSEVASTSESLAISGTAVLKVSPTVPALRPRNPLPPIFTGPVIVFAPPPGDLALDGVMRYYGGGTPTLGLQINVTNVGDSPVTAPSGSISINGVVLAGALYQYYGGTSTAPNTVNPGQYGYIKVEVPTSLMAPCTLYSVQIDLNHNMQSGGSAVFANDSGMVTTVCRLNWTSPIEEKYLGHVPDPAVAGKKLGDIVSSFVSGRPDGAVCSSCHNSGASYPYHPNVPAGVGQTIDPFTNISGTESWGCSGNPWATQFIYLPVARYPHTDALKEAVGKWQADGAIR
jgi:hypothetical protein